MTGDSENIDWRKIEVRDEDICIRTASHQCVIVFKEPQERNTSVDKDPQERQYEGELNNDFDLGY